MEPETIMSHRIDFFNIDSNCTKICKFAKKNEINLPFNKITTRIIF